MTDNKKSGPAFDDALANAVNFRKMALAALLPIPARNGQLRQPSAQPLLRASRGDFDLNPELVNDPLMQQTPRPAAVLVPIIARDELAVLLTLRPDHMSSHAGQIAFPGGKLEARDHGDPIVAALRETGEEIGLAASLIEPIGLLEDYRTGTGFQITPIVALVKPDFDLSLDAREVADAFEVPLRFLMNKRNHQRDSLKWQGRQRAFHAITYQDRYIWGATAAIIKNLHERLTATCSD